MKNSLYKIWKFFLPFIFIIVFVHFLKDITQDILKIPTFLDLLGNVNEDLSEFPLFIQWIIISLGYLSFGIEVFLVVTIPQIIKDKNHAKLEKYIIASFIFLVAYFISVTLIDPRYYL